MPKPKHYLKNLNVEYISLVDAGANLKELVYKSASRDAGPDGTGSADFKKQVTIQKTDEEKRLVYCIVYSPDEVDAHGDAMQADEIEKAAHHFLFEGRTDQVDKQHNEETGHGRIVESYIIGKSDANFPDDPEGSWAVVIKVLDDDTWDEVKKGTITGISMAGQCNKETIEAEGEEKGLLQKIKELVTGTQPTQKDFTERMMHRQIRQAVWAFSDEVHSQLDDDEVDDKKEAVLSITDDFRSYISDLNEETSKQFKPDSMSDTNKEKEKKAEQPTEIEKALKKALDEKLDPVTKKLEKVEERLDAVEKATPGSNLEKGQDDDEEEEEKERTTKGLNILGS